MRLYKSQPRHNRLRGAVRRSRDPPTDGLTDHSAVLNITSAHKLINIQDEKPRSSALRTPLRGPCHVAITRGWLQGGPR